MRRLLMVLVMGMLIGSAYASVRPEARLYQAQVPITQQTQMARTVAMKQAFIQVLIKVTGQSKISSNPRVRTALQNVNQYVMAYSYQNDPALRLNVRFNSAAVQNMLRAANIAIWPTHRPDLLAFVLVISNQGPPSLLTIDDNQAASLALLNAAAKRALPVILPMADLNLTKQAWQNELMSGDTVGVANVAKQLGFDASLTIIARQNKLGRWAASVGLNADNQSPRWRTTGTSLSSVIEQSVGIITDTLAKFELGKPLDLTSPETVRLTINNISNWTDYQKVQTYLKQLRVVKTADVLGRGANTSGLSIAINR